MTDAIKLAIDALEAAHGVLDSGTPKTLRKVEEALAALRAQPAGWMPIETAPKA